MTVLASDLAPAQARRVAALRYLPWTAALLDLTLVATSATVAVVLRNTLVDDGDLRLASSITEVRLLLVFSVLGLVGLLGGYSRAVFGVGTDEYKRVLTAALASGGITMTVCYLMRYDLSRLFVATFFVLSAVALVVGRYSLRNVLHSAHKSGLMRQQVLVAGSPVPSAELGEVLERERWLGWDVVGHVNPVAEFGTYPETEQYRVLRVVDAAMARGADTIVVAGGAFESAPELRRLAWELESHDIGLVVAPRVTDVSMERIKVRPVGGLPLIHVERPRSMAASRWSKRTFDLVGSAFLLLALAPLLVALAVRIKLHDGGQVFFRQQRVGRLGESFGCWKFRTMVPDAEQRLAALQAQVGFSGGLFKMTDDPRITTPGRWLRRFSLDELPQLFNVLVGQMSLVGPRPPLESETLGYDAAMRRRLHTRPGMTGLWQVSGRSDLSYEEAIRLDLYYVDNWSMVQDLAILARTAGAVLGSRGAY